VLADLTLFCTPLFCTPWMRRSWRLQTPIGHIYRVKQNGLQMFNQSFLGTANIDLALQTFRDIPHPQVSAWSLPVVFLSRIVCRFGAGCKSTEDARPIVPHGNRCITNSWPSLAKRFGKVINE
jgi:hypothetical protein